MFDKAAFLSAVLAKAGTPSAVGRTLNLESSRVAELYRADDNPAKPRGLKLQEAITLAEEYRVPLHSPMVSAETLKPILAVCLKHSKGTWSDRDVERLAQEIEYGLGLLPSTSLIRPSQDVLDVVTRAITDRLRDKPGSADPSS